MKTLLVQPPIQDFYYTPIRTQPIGLAYLASSLQSEGHTVEILDCRARGKWELPVPPEFSYLTEFYPFNDRSPFALYSGYYHFGMSWEQIRQEIVRADADVYGISSGFTPYHGEALTIARIIKEWDARKIVVMGGAHVNADPEGVLKSPLVDYVVLGEGERRLSLLLRELEKRGRVVAATDGIAYRRNGEMAVPAAGSFIDNLDALPHPARERPRRDHCTIRPGQRNLQRHGEFAWFESENSPLRRQRQLCAVSSFADAPHFACLRIRLNGRSRVQQRNVRQPPQRHHPSTPTVAPAAWPPRAPSSPPIRTNGGRGGNGRWRWRWVQV